MSRLAADCFAAAGRLQYTSFQTNSVDLNDALLVSIRGWKDAGSRELYIYDQVHMNGPPEMGRHFWGHLPLSWMHEPMLDFTLYYILFSNEEAGDDANPLWVLVLKDTRRQRPHRWTWQLLTTQTVLMHKHVALPWQRMRRESVLGRMSLMNKLCNTFFRFMPHLQHHGTDLCLEAACRSWKTCVPSGTWVQLAQINL